MGRELWSALHHEHGGNVPVFLNAVINTHPGGWSHFTPAIPAELECGRNFERCHHFAWADLSGDDQVKVKSDPTLSRLSMRDYVRANCNTG